MKDPERKGSSGPQDLRGLWRTAIAAYRLQDLIAEHRAGYRGFIPGRGLIKFPYKGNNEIDALDRLLDLTESLQALGRDPVARNERVIEWLEQRRAGSSWNDAPHWIRSAFRRTANLALDKYPLDLPLTSRVEGFSLEDLDRYWRELVAYAMYRESVAEYQPPDQELSMESFTDASFTSMIQVASGIPNASATAITARLTMNTDRCPDPALTPLVPIEQRLYPMPSLIMPGSPQRNMISILQADPAGFGRAGQLLGAVGEAKTLSLFDRLHERTKTASHVLVTRSDGTRAGDLDVVVADPETRTLGVFEIKWGLAADGNAQVYRSEQAVLAKRAQVVRLRSELASGSATPDWPSDWPDVSTYAWHWFVLSRDVLASRSAADEGVIVRSHQMLQRMLRTGSNVLELVELLRDPPTPPEALTETGWQRVRFGDLRIEIELIRA